MDTDKRRYCRKSSASIRIINKVFRYNKASTFIRVHLRLLIFPALLLISVSSAADNSSADAERLELLTLMGIGPEQLAQLSDAGPHDAKQEEIVLRVLMRLNDVGAESMEKWSQSVTELDKFVAGSKAARGRFFRLSGKAVTVDTVDLSSEAASKFLLPRYYRVRMILDADIAGGASERTIEILTRRVPRQWLEKKPLDERASTVALFLHPQPGKDGRAEPVFAAARVAWHPPTLLGELGMDLGLFDEVRDRQKIDPRGRECFYALLAAVGRAKPGQLLEAAREELKKEGKTSISVVPLFNFAANERGRLVLLCGTARRAVKVLVEDDDVVARYGIDHYYEVYLYTADSQANPLVFCFRELPQGMPTGSGPDYAEGIEAAGFFMQTWRYRPEMADAPQGDAEKRQLAPLLIGREPRWVNPSQKNAGFPLYGAMAGGVFILVLASIWLVVWRWEKNDRKNKRLVTEAGRNGILSDSVDNNIDKN